MFFFTKYPHILPSQVCLEFTFALPFAANAFMLRLISVKSDGSVLLYNLPSHHLHHKFVLSLPSHCFFTANAFTLRLIDIKRYGSVSLYNLPSHDIHHKFVLSLPSHCFAPKAPSRCALFLSRDMAVFHTTTYRHATSIASLS